MEQIAVARRASLGLPAHVAACVVEASHFEKARLAQAMGHADRPPAAIICIGGRCLVRPDNGFSPQPLVAQPGDDLLVRGVRISWKLSTFARLPDRDDAIEGIAIELDPPAGGVLDPRWQPC